MIYWQCSKCKGLKTTDDAPAIKEIVCCSRRLRELTAAQYEHEIAQRAYIDGGCVPGTEPQDTTLMSELGVN